MMIFKHLIAVFLLMAVAFIPQTSAVQIHSSRRTHPRAQTERCCLQNDDKTSSDVDSNNNDDNSERKRASVSSSVGRAIRAPVTMARAGARRTAEFFEGFRGFCCILCCPCFCLCSGVNPLEEGVELIANVFEEGLADITTDDELEADLRLAAKQRID